MQDYFHQLLLVEMVIDIYSLFSHITPQLLGEFAMHPGTLQISRTNVGSNIGLIRFGLLMQLVAISLARNRIIHLYT
jgi:hypothetical protein